LLFIVIISLRREVIIIYLGISTRRQALGLGLGSVVADGVNSCGGTEERAVGGSERIDSGVGGQSASLSPADDTTLEPQAVRALVHQWSARVTLAAVLASNSCAAHGGINGAGTIRLVALGNANCRYGHLKQLLADRSTRARCSPANSDYWFARDQMIVAVRWNADAADVVGESDRCAQTHESDVVGKGSRVVAGVHGDLRNLARNLSCFILVQEVAACEDAETSRLSGVSVDAMGGGHDPVVINNGSTASLSSRSAGTGGGSGHAHRHRPAPTVGNRRLSTDNFRLIGSNHRITATLRVRHCHEGGQGDYYGSQHCFPK